MRDLIKEIPDTHKIPVLYKLIELFIEEEDYESCIIVREELDKLTTEPEINRASMELFLRDFAKNKYVEVSYHIDIAEKRAIALKEKIEAKGGIDRITQVLDKHFNK